ncbi:MAG: IBR domain-containing protein [bacterium]
MRKILYILTLICIFNVYNISGIALDKKIDNIKQSLGILKAKLIELSITMAEVKDNLNKPKETAEERIEREQEEQKIAREQEEQRIAREEKERKKNAPKTCAICKIQKPGNMFPELACGCNALESKKFYCINEYNGVEGPVWKALDSTNRGLLKCPGCHKLIDDDDWGKIITKGVVGGLPNIQMRQGKEEIVIQGGKEKTKEERIDALKLLPKLETDNCGSCYYLTLKSDFPSLSCGHNQICIYCYDPSVSRTLKERNRNELQCLQCKKPISDDDLNKVVTDELDDSSKTKTERINLLKLLAKSTDKNFRRCPTPNCKEFYSLGNGRGFHEISRNTKYECPSCHKKYCPDCQEPWHQGACNKTDNKPKLSDIEKDEQITFLTTQRCPEPNCNIDYHNENNNCLIMHNSPCKHGSFCFGCGCREADEIRTPNPSGSGSTRTGGAYYHHVWACRNGYIYASKKNQLAPNSPTIFTIRFGREAALDFSVKAKWVTNKDIIIAPKPGINAGEYTYEYTKKLAEAIKTLDNNAKVESEIKQFYGGELEGEEFTIDVPELRITTNITRKTLQTLLGDTNKEFNASISFPPAYKEEWKYFKFLYPATW